MTDTSQNYELALLLFLFLGTLSLFSQQGKQLKIFVYENDKAIENFGVANLSTNKEGTYTDGYHVINASEGDELLMASDEFKSFHKLVTTEDIIRGEIEIHIKDGVIELEKVVITKNPEFTGFSKERILPVENNVVLETGKALKPSNILYEARRKKSTTLNIPFIPLINIVTGKSKRVKKKFKAYQGRLRILFLETHYKEFILEEIEVPEHQFELFCYFVLDRNKEIHKIVDPKELKVQLRRLYLEFIEDSAGD